MCRLRWQVAALALVALIVAMPAFAQVHTEEGEAGELLSTAQDVGAAIAIDGQRTDPNGPLSVDVDLYRVCLEGGSTFSASVQTSSFPPALALFDREGRAIYRVFGSSVTKSATLPAGHPLTPAAAGEYYLAVSDSSTDARLTGGTRVFRVGVPNQVLGPASTEPFVYWLYSAGSSVGGYHVDMTGVTACATPPLFSVSDFLPPINSGAVNEAKAGGVIPVKWLLTDADGNPVSDPSSFVSITTDPGGGICEGLSSVTVETWPGNSGLQYLGDGVWQFNWKVPKSYANQCRLMTLTLSDGTEASAIFEFK